MHLPYKLLITEFLCIFELENWIAKIVKFVTELQVWRAPTIDFFMLKHWKDQYNLSNYEKENFGQFIFFSIPVLQQINVKVIIKTQMRCFFWNRMAKYFAFLQHLKTRCHLNYVLEQFLDVEAWLPNRTYIKEREGFRMKYLWWSLSYQQCQLHLTLILLSQ